MKKMKRTATTSALAGECQHGGISVSRQFKLRRAVATALLLGFAAVSSSTLTSGGTPLNASTIPHEIDSVDIAARDLDISASLIHKSIELSDYAGSLEAELSERFPDVFSGVSIDARTSTISIWGKTRAASSKNFLDSVGARKHPYSVSVVDSPTSAFERSRLLVSVRDELAKINTAADLVGDVYSGKVIVEVARQDASKIEAVESRLARVEKELFQATQSKSSSDLVDVRLVDTLAEPTATAQGGNWATSCTIGLPLINASGSRFLATAGHCPSPQHVTAPSAINTSVTSTHYSGSRDIKILTVSSANSVGKGLRYKNSSGTWLSQSINAIKPRSTTVVGSIVCKAGKTLATACGEITTKEYSPSYVPNANATFIRAKAQSKKGDSGGPVFLQATAYGITSGSNNSTGHLIFQSVTYIPSGYAVLTTSS